MMDISHRTSSAISRFLFMATVLVVMCHADGPILRETRSYWVRFFGDSFSFGNTSNFFLVSGYLLAKHYGENGWWKKALRSRVSSLLVPYVGWCLVYYVLGDSLRWIHDGTPPDALVGWSACQTPVDVVSLLLHKIKTVFGLGLVTHPYDFALWYVKTLFYFILVSPFAFRWLLRSRATFVVSVVGVLVLRAVLVEICPRPAMEYFVFCFNLYGFAAFLCGAYCLIHSIEFPERLAKVNPVIPLILWTAVSLVDSSLSPHAQDQFLPVNVGVSVFCLIWISFAVSWTFPKALVASTFFVYGSHMLAQRVIAAIVPFQSFQAFAAIFIGSLAICLCAALTLNKAWPWMAMVLSGGRASSSVISRKHLPRRKGA